MMSAGLSRYLKMVLLYLFYFMFFVVPICFFCVYYVIFLYLPALPANTKKDTDQVTLAVCLGIILPLVIIPAIIIAVIFLMRRQRNKTNYGQKYDEEIGSSLKKVNLGKS